MNAQERARRVRVLRKVFERKAEIDPQLEGLTVTVGWNEPRRILVVSAVLKGEQVIPGMGGKTRPFTRGTELIIESEMLGPKDNPTYMVRKSREMLINFAGSA